MEEDENIKHDSKDLKPLQSKNSSSKDLHKKNITVKDLGKDIKLKKKAQKKMVNLCLLPESELDFLSSQSESSSSVLSDIRHSKKFDSAKKANAKFDFSLSDSSDSEKHSKEKQKKRKTKSGMSKKASDKVKRPQVWPHALIQYEFVSENISLSNLTFRMFVAGALELLNSKISKVENQGRMRLLQKMVYYSSLYEWKHLLKFYAAWLRRIEMGMNSWEDDSTQIEVAMLTCHCLKRKEDKGYLSKSEQVWWCPNYNKDTCSYASSHQKNVSGHPRLVMHICATCWNMIR